jgi:hypothetical protein
MTLIALLTPGSHPFLMGDLLISQPARYQLHESLVLPVAGVLASIPKSRDPTYVASGLRQKIAVVSRNIAVAYAGSAIAARAAITDIKQAFSRRHTASAEDVMRFLEAQTYPEIKELSLAGIVREPNKDRSSCFGWNTQSLVSEQFGTVLYAGSGAHDLEMWLEDVSKTRTRNLLAGRETTSYEEALVRVLSFAYMIIATQVFGEANNISSLYGGLMEIVSIIDRRVQRISNITCMFWVYDADEMVLNWTGLVLKSKCVNNILYIRRFDARQNDHSLHVVTPIYGQRITEENIRRNMPPLSSTYMCHVMLGLRGGVMVDSRARVDHRNDPSSQPIIFKETREGISMEVTEAWFESIRTSGFSQVRMPAVGELRAL